MVLKADIFLVAISQRHGHYAAAPIVVKAAFIVRAAPQVSVQIPLGIKLVDKLLGRSKAGRGTIHVVVLLSVSGCPLVGMRAQLRDDK